jgi:hypothetical protein
MTASGNLPRAGHEWEQTMANPSRFIGQLVAALARNTLAFTGEGPARPGRAARLVAALTRSTPAFTGDAPKNKAKPGV